MYLYFNLLTVDLREEFQSVTDHIKTTYTISLMTMVSAIELSRSAYLYPNLIKIVLDKAIIGQE